jgi:PEP-CTERM motif
MEFSTFSGRLVGMLRFDAPAVVLPLAEHFSVNSGPFVFNGQVSGFAADDVDRRVPLFDVTVTGQGTAMLSMDFENGLWRDIEAQYDFATTPEPASLILFGTALVGLAARRWRQVRSRRGSFADSGLIDDAS